jgi:thymidylate kinase
MLNLKCITIEGPDCAGKSSLYNDIHRETGFRWNIQDRGQLSMICYARLYKRGGEIVDHWRAELYEHLRNLNQRLIVLLPPASVLQQRLASRGDPMQNEESLTKLREIFDDELKILCAEDLPNVLVIRDENSLEENVKHCLSWLSHAGVSTVRNIASDVESAVFASAKNEICGLNFELNFKIDSAEFKALENPGVMQHLPEEAYYSEILSKVLKNIDDEINGKNSYLRPENPLKTRRFIFTQDSCITMIHTLIRGDSMTMKVYCRSSNVTDTFSHDLGFICYLYTRVHQHLFHRAQQRPENCVLQVEIGSAHLRLIASH